MRRSIFFSNLFYLIVAVCLCGCNSDEDFSPDNEDKDEKVTEDGVKVVYLGFNGDNGKKLYWATANFIMRSNGTAYIPADPYYVPELKVENSSYSIYSIPENAKEWCYFGWGDITGSCRDMDINNYGGENPPQSICGDIKYDIVAAKLGGTWRLPSNNEFKELYENCTIQWISNTDKTKNGIIFTSKINGKSIFLPIIGSGVVDRSKNDYRIYIDGVDGCYYSGTSILDRDGDREPYFALSLFLEYGQEVNVGGYSIRNVGRTIRPVCE